MQTPRIRQRANILLGILAVAVIAGVPLQAISASAAAPALPAGCVQSTPVGQVICSYGSTGSEQTFVVPDGVTQLLVSAVGASGGNGQSLYRGTIAGGVGATASSPIAVTSGATLYVEVGNSAGFNGGGPGVQASVPSSNSTGSGGGASDVRTTSIADAATLASRLLVAGGGGGGGGTGYTLGFTSETPLGGTGGAAGAAGNNGAAQLQYAPGTGGAPGTDSAGGAAGTDSVGGQTAGPGVLGVGGGGASYGNSVPSQNYSGGGGGGGGGWYGGGGGGAGFGYANASGGGGGGGGSSHVPSGGTIGAAAAGTAPSVTISYQPVGDVEYLDVNLSASSVTAGTAVTVQTVGVNARGEGVEDLSSSAQLSISPDGTCTSTSCTPAQPGDHIITATVGGLSASENVAATIASPVFTQSYPTVRSAVVGDSYSYTFAATGIPTPAFAVGSGSLPAGLTLDPDSGLLSGTLTTVGVSTFTVSATNGGTAATTPPITITVTLAAGCTQPLLAGVVTCVFVPTGAEQAFAVPAGVTSIDVTAIGGAGGDGAASYDGAWPGGTGGAGGQSATTVTVTPASTLFIEVGGAGASGPSFGSPAFNGGGAAMFTTSGGGGGASDVRTVTAADGASSLDSRLVVAGGGGGGGASVPSGSGGDGGAADSPGEGGQPFPFGGGDAGTGTAGGAGGFHPIGERGEAGSLGTGGASMFTTGGSGGGGLYGGGSGAGGYGSSFSASGGGGGSSWAPGGTTAVAPGIPASVTLSYQPPLTITAANATVQVGTDATFTVTGQDSTGASIDVSTSSDLTISPDGTCAGIVCTPVDPGAHTVTATLRTLSASVQLNVVSAPVPTVSLSSPTVRAGGDVTITGTGFPASTALSVTVPSVPGVAATANTSSTGTFSVTVTFPAGTQLGTHAIYIDGVQYASVEVTASTTPSGLPITGSDLAFASGLAVALLGLGLALVLTRRQRRQSSRPA